MAETSRGVRSVMDSTDGDVPTWTEPLLFNHWFVIDGFTDLSKSIISGSTIGHVSARYDSVLDCLARNMICGCHTCSRVPS